MLAFLQFPIADLRLFTLGGGNRLALPKWPPKTGVGPSQSFVRGFGPAMRRLRGADYAWLDEQSFCSAARALRFEKLPASNDTMAREVRCAFRRLFFDGVCVARVEIGLGYSEEGEASRFDSWDDAISDGSDPDDWSEDTDPFEVLDHVIALPTVVPYMSAKPAEEPVHSRRPLILQASTLARLYARATTENPGCNDESVAYDLVAPGNPLVIIECRSEGLESLPARFIRVDPAKIGGVELAFGRVQRYGGDLGVWLACYKNAYFDMVRSVRLCLARLHAEQEVLHAVLSNLDTGLLAYQVRAPHSERLERYLNKATKAVNRKKWEQIQQSAIREAFEAAEATQTRQEMRFLRDKLEGAKKQIVSKVEQFERSSRKITQKYYGFFGNVEVMLENRTINIGANAKVNAPVVMADKIENSFNQLASSETNNELKTLMGELLKQVAAAGNALSPESAEELARDAETLTSELTSHNPRRKSYEFILDNIKKAATIIGDVGKPILETASKLLPLLIKLFP